MFPSITKKNKKHYSYKTKNTKYNTLINIKPKNIQNKNHIFLYFYYILKTLQPSQFYLFFLNFIKYLLLNNTTNKKPTLLLPNTINKKPILKLPLNIKKNTKIQTKPPKINYILIYNLPPTIKYNTPIK